MNEKYKGDALLQKKFTVDFLQKKVKKNEGEVPQYYVEGNHEAIISPQVFDLVQAELEKRKKGGRYSGVSIFSNKIKCADCGGWYGSKIWHSTDQYRKVVYRCNRKYAEKAKTCQTMHVTEDEIKAAFVFAFNRLVSENARVAQDQENYQKRYNELVGKYNKAKSRFDEVTESISEKEAQSTRLSEFIKRLEAQDGILTEFDERLWSCMVEYATVGRKKEMAVRFKDGTEIEA